VKRIALPLLSCFLLALSACTATSSPVAGPQLKRNWAVVFPADKAQALTHQCSRTILEEIDGAWLPTHAEIAAMEPPLASLLETQLDSSIGAASGGTARDFYRQYGGLVLDGRRTIYVNGFNKKTLTSGAAGWRDKPADVCNGGTNYFGVEYDVKTRSFADFAFNGPA
jgi:hypothetical protein